MQINQALIEDLPKAKKVEVLRLLEAKEKLKALKKNSVVALIDPDKGLTHCIKRSGNDWIETDEKPDLYLPAKLECVLRSRKRFIVIIGGRGSSKSVSAGDICLVDARDNQAKTYCLREYQSSIKNSLHSLLKEEITRLGFEGFEALNSSIHYKGLDCFEFAGLARNVDSIKSAHGFKRFLIEEAQSLSQESIQTLTPTARAKPRSGLPLKFLEHQDFIEEVQDAIISGGVSLIFVGNPGSSEDPFSKRFITPFLSELDAHGIYEDELHLIVTMNYMDNPWFMESGLDAERVWDYENVDRGLYDHTWLGKFNDSVESALIRKEWFDACIDAHKVLGFEPRGVKIASHDPSDTGPDTKGYVMRHGSVVMDVQEKTDGNVNEGGHWAAGIAIAQKVDAYSWDGTGMGAGLSEQNGQDFAGKNIQLSMFIAAGEPDHPDNIYKPAMGAPVQELRTNKQAFKNKRAQYYFELRDRVYRTYRAVIHKEYADPDKLISFCGEMPLLSKLRAEVCRLPVKPNNNGLNELYSKEEMRSKFKIASPNLADPLMQTMRYIPPYKAEVKRPQVVRVMGRR